jgi:hypothetical protein
MSWPAVAAVMRPGAGAGGFCSDVSGNPDEGLSTRIASLLLLMVVGAVSYGEDAYCAPKYVDTMPNDEATVLS